MWLHDKIVGFFGIKGIWDLIQSHQFTMASLMTWQGLAAVISPIFPALLVVEIIFLLWINRRSPRRLSSAYKMPVLMYATNTAIFALVNLQVFFLTYDAFAKLALFEVPVNLYGFVYAYLAWELSHFMYHFTCHKVRLLWCFHAPHHAPSHMNLSVIFTAFFLQGVYATFVRTGICSALGVPLPLLFLIMVIDGCWGALIHVSEEAWSRGAFGGALGRLMLNPVHHRIHHASNAEYLDKNYCNTFPIWDKLFGTLQQEIPGVQIKYGLNRDVRPGSFVDMYFGEIYLLAKDVRSAPTFKQKLLYVVMPPGWEPIAK
ncbi:sterol desaturase family protein [Caballeronia sordidicola]|nr:sterol desaturase family protein [Caballeronia sordidicola]